MTPGFRMSDRRPQHEMRSTQQRASQGSRPAEALAGLRRLSILLVIAAGLLIPVASVIAAVSLVPGPPAAPLVTHNVADPAGRRIGGADSMVKVRPDKPVSITLTPNIAMAAARNEYETAQIVLSPDVAVNGAFVKATALTGPGGTIPESAVELFLAHTHNVTKLSDAAGALGLWPDALVPLRKPFEIRAGRTRSVWIRVFVPKGTPPGDYKGTLQVSATGIPGVTMDLNLKVWNITLPDERNIPFMVGLHYESIYNHEQRGESIPQFVRDRLPKYFQSLHRNRIYPYTIYGVQPDCRDSGGQLTCDFRAFLAGITAAQQGRIDGPFSIPLSLDWPVPTARHGAFTEAYNAKVTSYLRQAAAFLSERGLLDKAFIYVPETDEPILEEQYTVIERFTALVKAAHPRLRLAQTMHANCYDCKRGQGLKTLDPEQTLLVPNIAYFDGKAVQAKPSLLGLSIEVGVGDSGWNESFTASIRKRGKEFWWYLNPWTYSLPAPQPSYPTLYIDHQGVEHRVVGWMAFKYSVTGLGHWNATFWSRVENPWRTVVRGEAEEQPNGDGSLIYPARGSSRFTGQPDPVEPVTSIRVQLLREGLEDYELLRLLANRGESQRAQAIAGQVVNSLQKYLTDPEKLKLARARVAAALEQK